MGLVILGLVQQLPFLRAVAGRAGGVDLAEDHAQLARIGLAEEGVKFLDQRGNTGLFMHRLVRQRPKLRTQRGDHPRSEEHTSELQSLMRISYAVFCLKKKKTSQRIQ